MPEYPRYVYENVTVVEVVDGDSVKLIIDKGMHDTRCHIKDGKVEPELYRLYGIDAKKGTTAEGQAAKEAFAHWLSGFVRVETKKAEKYGRYMIIVERLIGDDWMNVNDALVKGGYAVPYSGKGKADA